MVMEYGGPRCAKYTLYFVNLVIIVLACVTLGVGIWMSTDVSSMATAVNPDIDPSGMGSLQASTTINNIGVSRFQTVANVLITSGVFALLIGFLGIWAAYKGSTTLLITYAVLMIIIVLLELGAGIAWAVDENKIVSEYTTDFNAALPFYDFIDTTISSENQIVVKPHQRYNNNTATSTVLINTIQTWIGCCGAENGYKDFMGSPYWTKSHGVPPVYCCKLSNLRQLTLADPACAQQRTPENSYMNVGCTEKITSWIYNNSGTIIGVAVGIGIIDLLGIVAAFYHYYCLTQGYKEF
ncbi:hypothetical protein BV898_03843 [Hypsibius exemplaris]|uniref:Tetraspanin n=1 Tax=Hypsibius exemplaris TaxID=2072580 RepID=A0A1W0X4D1_HYPEX|nr:hypothetical protein BV898_03843 [Hypsibius exemplaris]